jgi:hypothetical protein
MNMQVTRELDLAVGIVWAITLPQATISHIQLSCSCQPMSVAHYQFQQSTYINYSNMTYLSQNRHKLPLLETYELVQLQ